MIDWSQFSLNQQRYIVYMLQNPDAKPEDAARTLKVSLSTIRQWPDTVKDAIAVSLGDVLQSTKSLMETKAHEAVMVLSKQMTSKDERVAQAAAKALLEWAVGKPSQGIEHTGKNGGPVKHSVEFIWTDGDDNSGHGDN